MKTVRLDSIGLCLLIVVLGIALLLPTAARAESKVDDGTIPRILLAGDSWPWFLSTGFLFWTYEHGSAFRDILPETGRGRWSDYASTAVAGSMITQWSTNEPTATAYGVLGKLDWLRRELMEYPTIDIVHLGLGGNDYIRGDFRGFVHKDVAMQHLYHEFEWQTLVFSGPPTGGTFTLTFQGQTTAPIAFGADASEVQSSLEALSTIGVGNIEVQPTGGLPTYFCWFKGIFADTDVPMMSASGSGLIGGGVAAYGVTYEHGWKNTWGTLSPAEYAFAQALIEEQRKIVEYILDSRPDVRLVMTDYDYMQEDVGGAGFLEANESLVNGGLVKLQLMQEEQAKPQYANRIFFLNTYGLMQYTFGYPCDFTPLPNGTSTGERFQTTLPEDQYYRPMGQPGTLGTISLPGVYPTYTPWAGGDLNYPGPAMAILFDFGKKSTDPEWAKAEYAAKGGNIHLHKEGNHVFARYCVQQYYGAWLDQPKVLSVTRATTGPKQTGAASYTTALDEVSFEVTFSEPVTGVDEVDFSALMSGGLANAHVVSVTEEKQGTVYTVVVDTGTGDGSLGLAVIDNDSIRAVDDGGALAGDVDGLFSYGERYTVDRAFGMPVAAWPAGLALLMLGGCFLRKRS